MCHQSKRTAFLAGIFLAALLPSAALAVDGTVLINQAAVQSAGGFPYHITQSGSYRLSGNLVVMANTSAIIILAPNVTLDLNGFTISCTVCSGVPGVASSSGFTTILNGTVTGFNGTTTGYPYGIYFSGSNSKVDHVTVFGNGYGIEADTGDLAVYDSNVVSNAVIGVDCAGSLLLVDSKVTGNGQWGARMDTGVVRGSSFLMNGSVFILPGPQGGLSLNTGTVTGNVISRNGGFALYGTSLGAVVYGQNAFTSNNIDFNLSSVSMGNNGCMVGHTLTLC